MATPHLNQALGVVIRLLMLANGALALATASFVYVMLPFATGVHCEGIRRLGRTCGPISNT